MILRLNRTDGIVTFCWFRPIRWVGIVPLFLLDYAQLIALKGLKLVKTTIIHSFWVILWCFGLWICVRLRLTSYRNAWDITISVWWKVNLFRIFWLNQNLLITLNLRRDLQERVRLRQALLRSIVDVLRSLILQALVWCFLGSGLLQLEAECDATLEGILLNVFLVGTFAFAAGYLLGAAVQKQLSQFVIIFGHREFWTVELAARPENSLRLLTQCLNALPIFLKFLKVVSCVIGCIWYDLIIQSVVALLYLLGLIGKITLPWARTHRWKKKADNHTFWKYGHLEVGLSASTEDWRLFDLLFSIVCWHLRAMSISVLENPFLWWLRISHY